MPIQTRYFSFDELDGEQGWQLLAFLLAHGADEFSIGALVSEEEPPRMKAFFQALEAFRLPNATRRVLTAPLDGSFTREVERWRFCADSLAVLRHEWSVGPTSISYDEDLWLEDLMVYRDGEMTMAAVSHEGGGVIRLTELELAELRRMGFPDRESVPWIGY